MTTLIGYHCPGIPRNPRRRRRPWGCLCCEKTFVTARAARIHFFRATKREFEQNGFLHKSPHYKMVYWPNYVSGAAKQRKRCVDPKKKKA